MTVSTALLGTSQVLAVKKGTAWGTSAAVMGAGDGLSYLSGVANHSAPVYIDDSRGQVYSTDGILGPVTCAPKYSFFLRHNSSVKVAPDLLIALFMGTAGVPTVVTAPANTSIYKFAKDTSGLFASIARGVAKLDGTFAYVEDVPSAQVVGLTITGEAGPKPLTVEVDCIGTNKIVDGSGVNKTTTMNSVTSAETANGVNWSQLVFRLRSRDGVALSGTDIIYPSKWTLNMKRSMKGDYTGQVHTGSQDIIDQPSNLDMPELSLTLEFPIHSDNSRLAAQLADTRYKLDVTATGSVITGAVKYQHMWQFPHLQLMTVNPTDDNNRLKESWTFKIHGLSAATAGMPGIAEPLWWTVINKLATNPLA